MNIIRKQELTVDDMNEVRIGDQIQIGKYAATCQKITDNTVIFLLDQNLDKTYQMNHLNTNEGGYDASEFRANVTEDFETDPEFDSIRDSLMPFPNGDLIRIPTVGEILGEDDFYEMDDAEQWELMKNRQFTGTETEWSWLQNKVRESETAFAIVCQDGQTGGNSATARFGAWLVIQFAK